MILVLIAVAFAVLSTIAAPSQSVRFFEDKNSPKGWNLIELVMPREEDDESDHRCNLDIRVAKLATAEITKLKSVPDLNVWVTKFTIEPINKKRCNFNPLVDVKCLAVFSKLISDDTLRIESIRCDDFDFSPHAPPYTKKRVPDGDELFFAEHDKPRSLGQQIIETFVTERNLKRINTGTCNIEVNKKYVSSTRESANRFTYTFVISPLRNFNCNKHASPVSCRLQVSFRKNVPSLENVYNTFIYCPSYDFSLNKLKID